MRRGSGHGGHQRPALVSGPTDRALAVARLIGALYVVDRAWRRLAHPDHARSSTSSPPDGRAFADDTTLHTLGWLTALALPGAVPARGRPSNPRLRRRCPTRSPPAATRWPAWARAWARPTSRSAGWSCPADARSPALLVGPPGIVVLGQLAATRARAGRWTATGRHGSATTSGSRSRIPSTGPPATPRPSGAGWLADDHDFVVKVYGRGRGRGRSGHPQSGRRDRPTAARCPPSWPRCRPTARSRPARRKQVLDRIRRGAGLTGRADW